jgi:hypothetical protein
LKKILIRGMRDEFLDMLNLMGKGDISKEPFDDIVSLPENFKRIIKEQNPSMRPLLGYINQPMEE